MLAKADGSCSPITDRGHHVVAAKDEVLPAVALLYINTYASFNFIVGMQKGSVKTRTISFSLSQEQLGNQLLARESYSSIYYSPLSTTSENKWPCFTTKGTSAEQGRIGWNVLKFLPIGSKVGSNWKKSTEIQQ